MNTRQLPSLLMTIGVVLCSNPTPLHAQPFQKQVYSIPVSSHGLAIEHPFTGGFMNPMHQFLDLDGDGDLDLALYDFNDNGMTLYRNQGTRQSPLFRFELPWFTIPPTKSWFRFVDINGDGRADFLTDGDSVNTIAIYTDNSTGLAPQFSLLTSLLRDSAGVSVFAPSYCVVAFVDINGDGDRDFFSLNPCCGTINYYENIGSLTNIRLAFRTDRYQNIVICPGCGGVQEGGRKRDVLDNANLHGLGNLHFSDIDHDADFDIFYGDLNEQGILFYKNIGTPTQALFDSIGRFPTAGPVQTEGFNQPTFVDIDGDSDLDMFVSVLFFSQPNDNFWFFRNIGDSVAANFQLQTRNYLGTVDVGRQSAATFVDIDNDGDRDMFVGDLLGRLGFYRNVGTATTPSFMLVDSAYVSSATRFAYAPCFADIDADGDSDMFLGHFAGNVEFYRNIGTPTVPQFQRQISFLDSVNVGNYAAAGFIDIDGDQDLDLFVGSSNGRTFFFRNSGTVQVSSFSLVTAFFQNIDVGDNAKPQFVDVDGDGDKDLIVGSSDGKVFLYRNDGPPSNPVYTFVTNSFGTVAAMLETAPTMVDIDNDGDMDLFVGDIRGGVEFYRNLLINVGVNEAGSRPVSMRLYQNYPNPFNPTTLVRFEVSSRQFVTLNVYDVLGREVMMLENRELGPGSYERGLDATGLASGLYLYRLTAGELVQTKKLIVLK